MLSLCPTIEPTIERKAYRVSCADDAITC